jgi:hypothetical protein
MSDRYIIKNCPAKIKGKTKLCAKEIPYKHCQDCTDCVLKRIVELCKKAIKDCDKCKGDPETDCYDCTQGGKAILAHQILELLQEDNQ